MVKLCRWIFVMASLMLVLTLCNASFAGSLDQGGKWEYDILIAGEKVGTGIITSAPAGIGVLETRANVKFEINQGGQAITVALESSTAYTWPGGHPNSYSVNITPSIGPKSSITAQFGEKKCTVTIDAAGQKIPVTLETTGDEYLLDNNFMISHYWVMLSSLPPPDSNGTVVKFIVPQIAPRVPKILELTLNWNGFETIKLGGVERKAVKLSTQGEGLQMDFWLDEQDGTLLRWTVPEQKSEVLLSTVKQTEIGQAENAQVPAPSSAVQQYVGTYELQPGFDLAITLEGDRSA